VKFVNFARSGGSNRSFDIEIHTRGETVYTFSSIEKDEYHSMYDFLKSKKLNVKSTGKMDSSKLDLSEANVDHFAHTVKADAGQSSDENSMSSDDEDFNPDALEARDVKEEYDSDPSDTGSSDDEGSGDGSEGEKEKYDEEYKEWFESGGKEAIKNAKKAGKEAGKEGKAGSSKSPKKKKVAAEVTGGSGGGFQSKEFIEESDSNDNDSD